MHGKGSIVKDKERIQLQEALSGNVLLKPDKMDEDKNKIELTPHFISKCDHENMTSENYTKTTV